jgi:hypothetical protein
MKCGLSMEYSSKSFQRSESSCSLANAMAKLTSESFSMMRYRACLVCPVFERMCLLNVSPADHASMAINDLHKLWDVLPPLALSSGLAQVVALTLPQVLHQ